MRVNRRELLAGGVAGMTASLMPFAAVALTADQARAHIEATINELLDLLRTPGSAASRAPRLRGIMESRANLPRVAQFAAGRIWREMSEDQQRRYLDAFASYVARVYSKQFSEYAGEPEITIGRVTDVGQRGFLVSTPTREKGGQPIDVSWLVSDRGGRVEIADIIIEGVSMVTTQREEIGAMFQRRGSDIEALIKALASG